MTLIEFSLVSENETKNFAFGGGGGGLTTLKIFRWGESPPYVDLAGGRGGATPPPMYVCWRGAVALAVILCLRYSHPYNTKIFRNFSKLTNNFCFSSKCAKS